MEEAKTKSLAKQVLTIIIKVIITLIILFFIVFSWVLIKNPLNVRGILLYKLGWVDEPVRIVPLAEDEAEPAATQDNTAPLTPSVNPLPLTPAQRQAAEDFGIDPDSIIITPAMEECFIEKLGQERVNEIKNGATPGAMEILKASPCL